jgi:glycosyltransferase involved in cell wall biosynthesis
MDLSAVTIVVPTKNERGNIGRFLASLRPEIPLIVVDASADDTSEIVRRLRPSGTTILSDSGGIAASRQLGGDLVMTEWILFTDADVEFERSYFETLRRLRTSPEWGGIVGAKSSRGGYRGYYRIFALANRILTACGIPAATGSNMIVRTTAFWDAGGFDPSLKVNEDSELMWRVRRSGWKVVYQGNLKVFEVDHRRLDRGVLRKTVHSLVRCALLFGGLFPRSMRVNDWGYWRVKPAIRSPWHRPAGRDLETSDSLTYCL